MMSDNSINLKSTICQTVRNKRVILNGTVRMKPAFSSKYRLLTAKEIILETMKELLAPSVRSTAQVNSSGIEKTRIKIII